MELKTSNTNLKTSPNFHEKRKNQLLSLTLVPVFTVLMCVSAQITIPVPVIPFTLQVTVAIVSGLLLGSRLGFLSQALYLFMGLMGLPVFAGGGGGIGYVMRGSFGYLVGFLFCALVGGFLADLTDRRTNGVQVSYVRILLISLTALLVCYAFGITYLYFLSNYYTGYAGTKYSFVTTLAYGALPFIGKDVVLCFLAAELTRRLWRFRYRKGYSTNQGGRSDESPASISGSEADSITADSMED